MSVNEFIRSKVKIMLGSWRSREATPEFPIVTIRVGYDASPALRAAVRSVVSVDGCQVNVSTGTTLRPDVIELCIDASPNHAHWVLDVPYLEALVR